MTYEISWLEMSSFRVMIGEIFTPYREVQRREKGCKIDKNRLFFGLKSRAFFGFGVRGLCGLRQNARDRQCFLPNRPCDERKDAAP